MIRNVKAMHNWGLRFAQTLRPGDVLALVGDLGAGKTTLVQGLAEGLGYTGGAVSPTFALANEYPTKHGPLYHLDLYRLSERELAVFPLEDYFEGGICVIEWADRARARWPAGTLEIRLKALDPLTRKMEIRRA